MKRSKTKKSEVLTGADLEDLHELTYGLKAKLSKVVAPSPKYLASLKKRAEEQHSGQGGVDTRDDVLLLLATIKVNLPFLKSLAVEVDQHWGSEDRIYRFYHQSLKVFYLQDLTTTMVAVFEKMSPGKSSGRKFMESMGRRDEKEGPLHAWFTEIVKAGTGKTFKREDNLRWQVETRPILEAFFHARHFLTMMIRYGGKLKYPPNMLPSGWATVLYLYDLR